MAFNTDPLNKDTANGRSLTMGDDGQNSIELQQSSVSFLHNEVVNHSPGCTSEEALNLNKESVAGNLDHADLRFSHETKEDVRGLHNSSQYAEETILSQLTPKSQYIILDSNVVQSEADLNKGINLSVFPAVLSNYSASLQSSSYKVPISCDMQAKVDHSDFKTLYTDEQKIRDVKNTVKILPDSDDKELLQKKLVSKQLNRKHSGDHVIERDAEIVQLRKELLECQERETRLKRECDRLRSHLLQTEDRYTCEALEAEEREEELRKSLDALRQEMVSSSTDVLNAKSSAARQVENLRNQLSTMTEQRDDALQKLAAAEDTVSSYSSSLANLQMVLEQFQEEARQSQSVELEMCQKDLEKERLTSQNLIKEIAEMQKKLDELSVVANATCHLRHQISENEKHIAFLQNKLQEQEEEFSEAKTKWQQFSSLSEDKIDRLLVKNLLMGFIHTPPPKRSEAFTVVGHILDFTDAELESIGVSNSGSWLTGLFQNAAVSSPTASVGTNSSHSFSELFIRFLERESTPLMQPKLPAERMAQEHQEKQQRQLSLFLSSPNTSQLSSLVTTPTAAAEKFTISSHSITSSTSPVEHSSQFTDEKHAAISGELLKSANGAGIITEI